MITRKRREDNEQTFDAPIAEVFEDHDVKTSENKSADDDWRQQMAKQMTDMQNRLVESERANMALLTNPQNYSQVTETFTEQDPNKIELPDPALDPDGFSKATTRRAEVAMDNRRRREDFDNRRKQDIEEKVEDLWQSFGDKYPDMAEDKDRIDFISTQIAKQAAKRGVNVERYMFLTRDKFLDDVASKYIEVFGDPSEGENDPQESNSRSRNSEARSTSRARPRNRNRTEDEYVGRTAGVFGGAESGGRPARGRNDDDEDTGPSMIDDIYAIQKKTGFF